MKNEVGKDLVWSLFIIIMSLILGGCQPSSSTPSARHGAKMINDPVGKQVILFGGRGAGSIVGDLYNDIWAFDMETHRWQEVNTSSGPSPRLSPGLVYDPVHHQLILFGGYSNRGRINYTWLFDLNSYEWEEVFPALSPPARSDMGMAYDGTNHIAVLYGGYCIESQSDLCDDTWTFDPESNTWVEKNPLSSPPVIYGHTLNYDPLQDQFLLWGGHMSEFSQGGMSSAGYNDLIWVYSFFDNQWQEIPPGGQSNPSARYWHQAVFDSAHPGLLIFGGDGGYRYLADTWFFNTEAGNWTRGRSGQAPPARIVGASAYSPDHEQVILFGGLDVDFSNLDDTWIYSDTTGEWEQISP